MNECLGKIHFWGSVVTMNLIFMPMFLQGMSGVSRRWYDGGASYDFAKGVLAWNIPMSYAAWGLALFQIPFIINLFMSICKGEKTCQNPWEATTLEWVAPSPPPHGNFDRTPEAFRGPYEYGLANGEKDFIAQNQPNR